MAARSKASGAATLRGSKKARQLLAVILEAFSGLCGTSEAAERLGISLSRYYQLETRALQGMLAALEPRPRGPRKTPGGEIRTLKERVRELERELRRHQSLLRATSRTLGVKAARKKKAKKQRGVRGAVVLKTLKEQEGGTSDGSPQRDGAASSSD